jgi:hypothetical protein
VSKRFRTCDLEQVFLLSSLQDWLPEEPLARFVDRFRRWYSSQRLTASSSQILGMGTKRYERNRHLCASDWDEAGDSLKQNHFIFMVFGVQTSPVRNWRYDCSQP